MRLIITLAVIYSDHFQSFYVRSLMIKVSYHNVNNLTVYSHRVLSRKTDIAFSYAPLQLFAWVLCMSAYGMFCIKVK